nr:MAG TPA: hypothetical protein [Caudoviricetes sp.]
MDNIVNLYMEAVIDTDNIQHDIETPEVDELAICEGYMALEEGRVMLEMYQRRETMYAESVGGIFVALLVFIKKAILIILKMVLGIKGLLLLVVIGLIMYFRKRKKSGISFGGGGSSSSTPKLKIKSELMNKVFEGATLSTIRDKYSNMSEPVVLLDADSYNKSNAEFKKIVSSDDDHTFPKFILETALNAPGILLLSAATQLNVNRYIGKVDGTAIGVSSNIANTTKSLYKDVQEDLIALLAPLKTQSVDFNNKESVDKFEKDSNEVLSKLYSDGASPKSVLNYGDISKVLQIKSESHKNLMSTFYNFTWEFDNDSADDEKMSLQISFDDEKMSNQSKIYKIFSELAEGKDIDDGKIKTIKEKIGKLSGYQNSIKSIVDNLDETNAIEDKGIVSEINKWITVTIAMTSSVMYSVQIGQVVKNVIDSKIFHNMRRDILNAITGKIKGKEKNLLQLVSGNDKENEEFIRTNFAEYLK